MRDDRGPRDRRVHAVTASGGEIVRYERAGKWYLEWDDRRARKPLRFADAVRLATGPGAIPRLGVVGGTRFDAVVQKGEA